MSLTDPPGLSVTDQTRAAAYARALATGLVSADEVVEWADSLIANTASPNAELIDASLSRRHVSELISVLGALSKDPPPSAVAAEVFGIMRRALQRDGSLAERIAAELYRMVSKGVVPSNEAESEMWSFEDDLELTRRGVWGDRGALVSELEAFLEEYAAAT